MTYEMVYEGFYNFCPNWTDHIGANRGAFFCRMPIKLYGFQYVFCCGNLTHRYCCQDPDKYYIHGMGGPEPDFAYLLLLQYWPVLAIVGLAILFGAATACSKSTFSLQARPRRRVTPVDDSFIRHK